MYRPKINSIACANFNVLVTFVVNIQYSILSLLLAMWRRLFADGCAFIVVAFFAYEIYDSRENHFVIHIDKRNSFHIIRNIYFYNFVVVCCCCRHRFTLLIPIIKWNASLNYNFKHFLLVEFVSFAVYMCIKCLCVSGFAPVWIHRSRSILFSFALKAAFVWNTWALSIDKALYITSSTVNNRYKLCNNLFTKCRSHSFITHFTFNNV